MNKLNIILSFTIVVTFCCFLLMTESKELLIIAIGFVIMILLSELFDKIRCKVYKNWRKQND